MPSAHVLHTFGRFATATSVPTRHSPAMREMSVTEQRYKALLAVIGDELPSWDQFSAGPDKANLTRGRQSPDSRNCPGRLSTGCSLRQQRRS